MSAIQGMSLIWDVRYWEVSLYLLLQYGFCLEFQYFSLLSETSVLYSEKGKTFFICQRKLPTEVHDYVDSKTQVSQLLKIIKK